MITKKVKNGLKILEKLTFSASKISIKIIENIGDKSFDPG